MHKRGFTLAELLIALAILGVIATFTIPKVLQAQQSSQSKAIAKEAAASLSAAYEAYRLNNTPGGTTTTGDITPYLNYVTRDTLRAIDYYEGGTSVSCAADRCLVLHNGAVLWYKNSVSFAGTGSTNAVYFQVDPDGTYSGLTTGPGKAVRFYLYYNGRIRTYGTVEPNTVTSDNADVDPNPSNDPTWFGWD